jgi:hypothetical protein
MQKDEPVKPVIYSLKEPENIEEIRYILNDLEQALNENILNFKIMFKNLPLNIYLKIDSLANTFASKNNPEIKELADKAKFLSKEFHKQFK